MAPQSTVPVTVEHGPVGNTQGTSGEADPAVEDVQGFLEAIDQEVADIH